jgi:uncharacterized membrane protein
MRICCINTARLNRAARRRCFVIKIMSAVALIAASLAAAPAFAAPGNDYQAQAYKDPFYYTQNRGQNDSNSNQAFTQGCPPGAVPESWPNGSGRRCALPGGGYSY